MAKLFDYDGSFLRGAKSDIDPGQLPLGFYFSGLNVINQGGMISCRPGHYCLVTFPEGNLQGGAVFYPKLGLEQMVVVVDGRAYASEFPFRQFTQLENILFSASAQNIYFALTEQSAIRTSPGELVSAIELISPKAVLIMQDGGETAPAFYDGSESGHIRDNDFETPVGGPMAWIGDRLWVAKGSFLYASDISNPFSFRETIYLGGTSAFTFSGDITALAVTPSLEFPQLLVFTERNCSLLQANIRLREEWEKTADFQREVFAVGCTSQRSVVSHFGQLTWFSSAGQVFFDAAILSKQAARLPIRDTEMTISKSQLAGDLRGVAGGAFGQYILMSVPAEDKYNKHTWVLNNASIESLTDDSGPSWCGLWTGTRPVQWLYGVIAGQERIYHLSKDLDGQNRLWESFTPDQLDNGCPITWASEMRGYFGQSAQVQGRLPGSDCKLRFADIKLVGIAETLDIGVYYAGGLRGAYKQIADRQYRAEKGVMTPDLEITLDTVLYSYKPQSRTLRTQDVTAMPLDETGSCSVERQVLEGEDESFQLMVVGHGPATIRAVRVFADTVQENDSATPDGACGSEVGFKAVRFDGFATDAEDTAEASLELAAAFSVYTSNQTVTVSQDGISAVGIGHSESVVSQRAADRAARRIAERMAENEVIAALPPVLSAGGVS